MLLRRPWLRAVVRGGYLVRGVTYFLVGSLAFGAARGRGDAENTPGALLELLEAPAGRFMLLVMACGLIAFGLWRTGQAFSIEAPEHLDWMEPGHLAYVASAFVYFVLGFTAVSPLLGWYVPSGERQTVLWTEWLLTKPLGVWLVGAIGIVVAGVGLYWCISAFVEDPMPSLDLVDTHRYWVRPLCGFGLVSWGVMLGLTGTLFVLAAVTYDSSAAVGFEGALRTIQRQPFGRGLLTVVALGLAAYGVFSVMEGLFRKIGGSEQLFD